MKTRYRFIHFTHDGEEGTWLCRNNRTKQAMGTVGFYGKWNQWIWGQNGPEFIFSMDCLTDIAHFMGQLEGGK